MGSERTKSLNPLKRVNSILTELWSLEDEDVLVKKSQSPQTGQFNSYDSYPIEETYSFFSLNPLKRVNSILTDKMSKRLYLNQSKGLNPLKRVNSILTSHFERSLRRLLR